MRGGVWMRRSSHPPFPFLAHSVSHGIVVEHCTVGQQVEPSILYLGHDSYQNSSQLSRLSPIQVSRTIQNGVLRLYHFHFSYFELSFVMSICYYFLTLMFNISMFCVTNDHSEICSQSSDSMQK